MFWLATTTIALTVVATTTAFTTAQSTSTSALTRARALQAPVATRTVDGEFEHADFWAKHGSLVKEALSELGLVDRTFFQTPLDYSRIVAPRMHSAVANVRNNLSLTAEARVKQLWQEHEGVPGVYVARDFGFLSEEAVRKIRKELERVSGSGVPLRRPNGMNRRGVMLDDEVDGGFATLGPFIEDLVQE